MSTDGEPIVDVSAEEPYGSDSLDRELQFLQAAGLDLLSLTLLNTSHPAETGSALAGLTETITALAQDVSEEMGALGARINVLETKENWSSEKAVRHWRSETNLQRGQQ